MPGLFPYFRQPTETAKAKILDAISWGGSEAGVSWIKVLVETEEGARGKFTTLIGPGDHSPISGIAYGHVGKGDQVVIKFKRSRYLLLEIKVVDIEYVDAAELSPVAA